MKDHPNCSACGNAIPSSHPCHITPKGKTLCRGCFEIMTVCAECGRDFDGESKGFLYTPPTGDNYYLCPTCHANGMLRLANALDPEPKKNDSATIAEAVDDFGVHMKHKLLLNRHKPHWSEYTDQELFERVKQESAELLLAIKDADRKAIVRECADVANFCCMMADNAAKGGTPCSQLENGADRKKED